MWVASFLVSVVQLDVIHTILVVFYGHKIHKDYSIVLLINTNSYYSQDLMEEE